ncbi:MAG TPA: ABC transporter ATP-binding protein [Xanthobacteraceae bacterium]|jgi:iron(III) transport system ATP-binding protein|nr:ABC transporter ATP-binding protein [Xanthobacteraceae bacterium]
MTSVTINNVSKSYGAKSDVPAVSDLNLNIRDNSFVTLLGPSGCGKTTTLRLIAGYMSPDTGTIHVGDKLVSSKDKVILPEHRGMGMVFQNYAVWPHKTVFENVVFGLRIRKVPTAKAREMVDTTLALVGLTGYEKRFPSELSGGQQQRVALARSIVVEPEILLLDEPLSNLDAKLREHMRTELKQIQRRTGITFIYVTHDQAEALALSDHIAVINNGKLQQFGTPEEVYSRPANRVVADFMGNVNLVRARIMSNANGKNTIRIGDSLDIETPEAAAKGLSTQGDVDIAVRPEDIMLSGSGTTAANATVKDRTFLGNFNEYYVAIAGGPVMRVQTHPKQVFEVGSAVGITVDGSHVSVFAHDPASKKMAHASA